MSIAAVKIAQKKTGTPDGEYRAILRRVAGVESATKLDERGCRAVVAELYKGARKPRKSAAEMKIWALWYDIKPHLPVQCRTYSYLLGFCRKAASISTPLESLAELEPREAYKCIEALKNKQEDFDPTPF